MPGDRYARGKKKLNESHGEMGEEALKKMEEISPDFVKYIIEFPYGDVYSRPGLDLKTREITTVAALIALGNAGPQLKVHMHAALRAGWTEDEIKELVIQMAVYAGFPAAMNAMTIAGELFKETRNKK